MEPSPFVVPRQRPMESSQNLFKSNDISWGFNDFFFDNRDPYEITEVRPPATEESVVEAASVIAGQLQRILDFDQFQNEVKKKLSQLEKRIDRKYQLPILFMWKSVWFLFAWSLIFLFHCLLQPSTTRRNHETERHSQSSSYTPPTSRYHCWE